MVHVLSQEEYDESLQENEEFTGRYMTTPDEMVGKIVRYDVGGFNGRRFAEVVAAEPGDLTVEELFTRKENHLTSENGRVHVYLPYLGEEYEVWCKEVKNDGWEVVEYMHHEPHSLMDDGCRVTSRRYVHGLGDYSRYTIRGKHFNGEDLIVSVDDVINDEEYKKMLRQVDESEVPDTYIDVIDVWFDVHYTDDGKEFELVFFNIENSFRRRSASTAIDVVDYDPMEV